MPNTAVILMDCWAYSDSDPMRAANLRSQLCANINNFFQHNAQNISVTINACYYPGTLNPLINVDACPGFVNATEQEDFAKIYDKYLPTVIYYLGMHWNRCIRTRPLGYAVVQEILKHRATKPVHLLAKQSCTIELVEHRPGKQYSPTYERWPDFARDSVTELDHVHDDVYEIVGIHKDWDGRLR